MSGQPQLADPAHGEIWSGLLLRELVAHGKDGLSPACKVYAEWAKESFSWWRQDENPKLPSWNMFVVEGACLLWLDPALIAPDGESITDWWSIWLALQCGELSFSTAHPISRCFDGSETLSAMYGDGRYGAVAAVRLLALRHPQHPAAPELIRLTGRYLEVLATLLALSSRPWTDPGYKADNGRPWYAGPTISPVGERSEAAGLQNDRGPILETLLGRVQSSNRSGWPAAVFSRLIFEFPASLPLFATSPPLTNLPEIPASAVGILAGVRLWSEQHWVRWNNGLLVWKPRRQNSNTPCIFWAWMDDNAKRMTIGYPYPAGKHRGKGASGAQGGCVLRKIPGGRGAQWIVSATGIDGGSDADLTLPVSGDPLWSIVGDTNGFREEQP